MGIAKKISFALSHSLFVMSVKGWVDLTSYVKPLQYFPYKAKEPLI